MDAATLSRAIEPFYSTKALRPRDRAWAVDGARLAAQSAGLELTSSPGKGTRAELWLPAADQVEPRSSGAVHDAVHALGGPATVLLVDDERWSGRRSPTCCAPGLRVVEAGRRREALRLIADRPGSTSC
jgi:hypothetical protein